MTIRSKILKNNPVCKYYKIYGFSCWDTRVMVVCHNLHKFYSTPEKLYKGDKCPLCTVTNKTTQTESVIEYENSSERSPHFSGLSEIEPISEHVFYIKNVF